jgi:uncharacterized protein (TIGR02118 family)
MLKMIFLLHRRPAIDADEFSRYWSKHHAPIARKLPVLRKYVQNHARAAGRDAPAYVGVAEMWWDDAKAFEASLASPEGQSAQEDAARFMDVERIQPSVSMK